MAFIILCPLVEHTAFSDPLLQQNHIIIEQRSGLRRDIAIFKLSLLRWHLVDEIMVSRLLRWPNG